MKNYLVVIYFLLNSLVYSQVPYSINSSGNTNFTSGNFAFYASNITIGTTNYVISSSAKVSNIGAKYVNAQVGFQAGNFTAGNFAALIIDTNMMELVSLHPNGFDNINKYEKFEVGIKLPSTLQSQINGFLSLGAGINPYDPDQIRVECEYTDPNQVTTYVRNGFYYNEFSVSNNNWVMQTNNYTFRMRFAPPNVGSYKCKVSVYLNNTLSSTYALFNLNVQNSTNPGHLIMANGNLRKMKFQNGNTFFGVGQDIGYVPGDFSSHSNCLEWYCRPPSRYDLYRSYITDLADNDGNLVRLRLDPFDFPIEWKEWQMLSSNPVPTKTLLQCLNNYDHNQKFMWEFDKVMNLCENRGVYVMLNILLDQSWCTSTTGDAQDFAWQTCPYSALLGTSLPNIKTFFTDPAAKAYFKKLLYYIHARWGYSTNVGIWEMINETENLEGYKTDAGYAANVKNWVCEMKSYLETLYPWHPTTNGHIPFESGSPLPAMTMLLNQPSCLNINSRNSYGSSLDNCSYQNVNFNARAPTQDAFYSNFKPFIFGEMGASELIDKNIDREFHNSIWATTMMGGIGCGLMWNDAFQELGVTHRNNFKSLRSFTNRIDWTMEYVIGKDNSLGGNSCKSNDQNREVFSFWQRNLARNIAFGWAMNASSNWISHQNEFINSSDYTTYTSNNCSPSANAYTIFDNTCNPQIHVNDLLGSTSYRIEIFDPYDPSNQLLEVKTELSDINGNLKFRRKMTDAIISPFYPDYAFFITTNSSNRLAPGENPIDTLTFNSEDSLCINATQNLKDGNYSYKWSVNKKYVSSDSILCLNNWIVDSLIQVALIAKSSDNQQTYFKEYVFRNEIFLPDKQSLIAYPNPANDFINVTLPNKNIVEFRITVQNELGQILIMQVNQSKINVSNLTSGFYLLKIYYNGQEKSMKLLISH